LQVTTFDLSPRSLDHLARARGRALRGSPYVVQLPHDPQAKWKPELVKYWEVFGDQIGKPAARPSPLTVPAGLSDLKLRAVRIAPAFVARITPVDLKHSSQRMAAPAGLRLIIATNIWSITTSSSRAWRSRISKALLRDGGFLLSNNALLELPVSKMKSVNY